jgi:hypothetical protein
MHCQLATLAGQTLDWLLNATLEQGRQPLPLSDMETGEEGRKLVQERGD